MLEAISIHSLIIRSDLVPHTRYKDEFEELVSWVSKGADNEQTRASGRGFIGKLREEQVPLSKAMSLEEVVCKLGLSDATYCKGREDYGGFRVD